jgi:hypothetical protein
VFSEDWSVDDVFSEDWSGDDVYSKEGAGGEVDLKKSVDLWVRWISEKKGTC